MQVTKHASEGSSLALKPRADITRSPEIWYQWLHKKPDILQTFLKNCRLVGQFFYQCCTKVTIF